MKNKPGGIKGMAYVLGEIIKAKEDGRIQNKNPGRRRTKF